MGNHEDPYMADGHAELFQHRSVKLSGTGALIDKPTMRKSMVGQVNR